ncbi:MAG: hypothetical protein KDE51_23715 [Anaerolineales bacterium]|nr:hypothetical protein [Anaerolineales bacterium]
MIGVLMAMILCGGWGYYETAGPAACAGGGDYGDIKAIVDREAIAYIEENHFLWERT